MAMEAVVNIDWIEKAQRGMLYNSVVLKRTDQSRNEIGDFFGLGRRKQFVKNKSR